MWKGAADETTGDVDGVGPVWPKYMTGMSEEEEEDCFFVATPSIVDTGTGETSVVKVELIFFLEVMVAWVRKLLV